MENSEKRTGDITAEEQREMFAFIREFMTEQKKRDKKRNRLLVASAAGSIGLFCVLLIGAAVVVPGASSLMEDIDAIANSLQAEQLTTIVGDIKEFTHEAVNIVGHANDVLDDASGAVANLEQIDIEQLNEAISNLNSTVKPLADFFSLMS